MTTTRKQCRGFVALFSLMAVAAANAATLTWDTNTAVAAAQDGGGLWTNGLPATNWWNGAANTNWNSATPDNAVFGAGGTAGTVTLPGPVSVGNITFTNVGSGNYVIQSNTLSLVGTPTIDVLAGATINSSLAGSGFVKTNAATLTLGGANTYTGVTMLAQGIIQANANGALGNSTLSITNAAVRLIVGNGVTLTNAIVIGPNGGTTGNGLVQVSATTTGTISGPVTINNNATAGGHFASASANTAVLKVNGAITSSVPVVSRVGYVIFSGGGSYANFTIGQDTTGIGANNGISTSAIMNVAASGAGTFDLRGFNQTLAGLTNTTTATVTNTGVAASTLTLNNTSTQPYSGAMGANMSLVMAGTGTQLLTGTSTYTGGTTIAQGALSTIAAANLGTGPIAINSSGTLVASPAANQIIAANISGGGTFVKAGTANLQLQGSNSFSGNITVSGSISAGALVFDSVNSGLGQPFVTNNGWITLSSPYVGANLVLSGLAGTGLVDTAFNAATGIRGLTVNQAGNSTYSGTLKDSSGSRFLALTKTGAGSLTLSGANNLSGGVTISNGTLALAASGSFSNSTVTVGSNGTFDVTAFLGNFKPPTNENIQGFGMVSGTVIVAGSTPLIMPGTMGTPGTLTIANDFYQWANYTNYFDLTNDVMIGSGINDLLVVNGNFEPGGASVYINPLAPLISGTYSLINYGSSGTPDNFNATVQGNTKRGDVWTLDTSVSTQVNLIVSAGTNQSLQWSANISAVWDLGTTNWTVIADGTTDRYFDVDTVLFNDIGAASNIINLATVVKPAAVTVNSSSNYTFTGTGKISNGFGQQAPLTKDGSGTLTIATTNDFTGGIVVSNGTVVMASRVATGAGPVTLAPGTTLEDDAGNTLSGAVSGSGRIIKTGAGVMTLNGASSFSGDISISNGTFAVIAPGYISGGPYSGNILNNGSLSFSNSTQNISGIISGTGALTLPGSNSVLALTGTNMYAGLTTVFGGALTLASSNGPAIVSQVVLDNNLSPKIFTTAGNQFGSGVVMTFSNNVGSDGRFELIGTTQTLAGIQTAYVATKGIIQNQEMGPLNTNLSLLILNGAGNYFYSGSLRDSPAAVNTSTNGRISLTKTGPGSQTFWGLRIDYTGPTIIGGGSLILTNVDDLWSTAITISNGAGLVIDTSAQTFQYKAKGTVSGAGVITKLGGNNVMIGSGGAGVTMAMAPGGLIDVRAGLMRN